MNALKPMLEIRESDARTPSDIKQEFIDNAQNGRVGQILASETENLRVWLIKLRPGERNAVHVHQLDYFWTVHGPAKPRVYYSDGLVADCIYRTGDTRHFTFERGEHVTHCIKNIGKTDLVFTVVEYLKSANPPLPIG